MNSQPLAGWLLGVIALALPGVLLAAQLEPLDAEAAVPAQDYRSPLQHYRPLPDEPVQDWRGANDQVGRIGGWRAYAQEGWEQPDAAAETMEGDAHEHH